MIFRFLGFNSRLSLFLCLQDQSQESKALDYPLLHQSILIQELLLIITRYPYRYCVLLAILKKAKHPIVHH